MMLTPLKHQPPKENRFQFRSQSTHTLNLGSCHHQSHLPDAEPPPPPPNPHIKRVSSSHITYKRVCTTSTKMYIRICVRVPVHVYALMDTREAPSSVCCARLPDQNVCMSVRACMRNKLTHSGTHVRYVVDGGGRRRGWLHHSANIVVNLTCDERYARTNGGT